MVAVRVGRGRQFLGHLRFYEKEDAFFFVSDPYAPFGQQVPFSSGVLSVGYLEIRVNVDTGQAFKVEGFHPRTRWEMADLESPDAAPGSAFFVVENPGFSVFAAVRVVGFDDMWTTFFDPRSEWIRIVQPDALPDDEQVLIATGTVIGVRKGLFNSIWLQPQPFARDPAESPLWGRGTARSRAKETPTPE